MVHGMIRLLALLTIQAMLLTACGQLSEVPTGHAASTQPTGRTQPPLQTQPASAFRSAAASPHLTATSSPSDALLDFAMLDVRTGETFTLRELATKGPVLVEAMAVWCSSCRAQQREVVRAHALTDFQSVSIDVDPNERASALADYARREGFDWRFVRADAQLVKLLSQRYGFGVTNPPSTPTLVISGDVARALEFGRLRSADELVAELRAG